MDPQWVRCVKKEWLLPFQLHGLIERSTQWLLLLVVVVVVVVEAVFLEQRILRCPLGSFSEADWQEVDCSWGEAGCQSVSVMKREQVLRWTGPTAVQAAFSGVHMLRVFCIFPSLPLRTRDRPSVPMLVWNWNSFLKSSIADVAQDVAYCSCFCLYGQKKGGQDTLGNVISGLITAHGDLHQRFDQAALQCSWITVQMTCLQIGKKGMLDFLWLCRGFPLAFDIVSMETLRLIAPCRIA